MVTVTFTPSDGGEPIVSEVTKASVLREVALGDKVPLYAGMSKLLNCGGIGNCGTCRVVIEQGAELLSERTDAERKKLKGKGDDNRLACQCLIGGPDAPEGAELRVTVTPPK
ncbi:(2Fe-2S)-binding protein [bacterium]|jgi:ferredoxin|nr:(2Fe-2S)-binding protein [bacterium]|tara:strand:- start:10345 stop:10680 length:336 start_codon:yes stop_codon:yes gene_type:complete